MMERIRRARREEGFTLIEVLVVISILGVLAGIAVFGITGLQDAGKDSACKTDKKTVQTAQAAHRSQTGSYAASVADLSPAYLTTDSVWYSTDNTGAVTVTAAGTANSCS